MDRNKLQRTRGAFARNEDGATAVEFALVAPLLFLALFSIVEIGMLSMMSTSLDHAVSETGRRIRTGRDDAATSAATFEDQVCTRMGGNQVKCKERLVISVQKFSRFTDANALVTAQPAGQFNKGEASDIILVKANYTWPLMSPFIATAYHRDGPLNVTLGARKAFKNEPFE